MKRHVRHITLIGVMCVVLVFTPFLVHAENTQTPKSHIAFSGGDLDGHAIGLLTGQTILPLGTNSSLQIDGLGAYSMNSFSASLGSHLTWRDPQTGLIGLYAAYMERDWPKIDGVGNLAFEASYYTGNWNITGQLGVQFEDHDDLFFASYVSWYPETVNLHLYAGFSEQIKLEMIHAGFEYDPNWQGYKNTTFFLNSIYTGCDETLVHIGVKFYFGSPKTLKSRHREDEVFTKTDQGNLMYLEGCHSTGTTGGGGAIIGM